MTRFTSIHDVPDPAALVSLARELKHDPYAFADLGRRKTLLMVFFNPSLRTRLSTEVAAKQLGLEVMSMNAMEGWQLEFADGTVMDGASAEHVREAAGVMSQYADIIAVRSFPGLQDRAADYADTVINAFAQHTGTPFISLESAIRHPLQSLADWLTIEEYRRRPRPKVVLTWAPHPRALPQAVANSFLEWLRRADVELVLTHPEGYELAPEFVGDVPVVYDQREALRDADFVYAKNWSAYTDYGKILSRDNDWMITGDKMALTNEGYFMHCLPVRRNQIVADEVLDSPASIVLAQARNRVFAAQAVMLEQLRGL